MRTVYVMRILYLGGLGDWKASSEQVKLGLCSVYPPGDGENWVHTSWVLFIVLKTPSIPALPMYRTNGAHLSSFSRISAMLVSGFRRWCLRLRCSRGRQMFHCAVHSTWMVVGLPRRMARCSMLSSLFMITSCSYKGHSE